MVFTTIKKAMVRSTALVAGFLALAAGPVLSQNVIGGGTPDTSAVLDLQSTQKGFLPPRMSTAQRNAIALPATGLIVYNTEAQELQINLGTPSAPSWGRLATSVTQGSVPATTPLRTLPGGTFSMGCTSGDTQCQSDESPVRQVTLSPFQIGETELTQGEWASVYNDGVPSYWYNAFTSRAPLENVTWFEAVVFCNRLSELHGLTPCYYSDAGFTQVLGKSGSTWVSPPTSASVRVYWNTAAKGYRLPTEAEWEYAARGGSATNLYSGSNTITYVGWHNANTNNGSSTQYVKRLFPNGYGLYDMTGNVSEWVWDLYGTYPNSAETNPTGPSDGRTDRTIREGNYANSTDVCRVSNRGILAPTAKSINLGFRIARSL